MVSIPRSKTLSAKSTASNLLVSLAQRQIFPLSNLERFRLVFLLWKNLFKITSIVLKNSDGTYSLSSNAKSQKHCWRLPKNSWLAWVIFVSHITCIKSPTTKFCFFNLPFDRGCFEKFLKCGNSKKRWVMAGSTKKKNALDRKTHLEIKSCKQNKAYEAAEIVVTKMSFPSVYTYIEQGHLNNVDSKL